MNTPSHFSDTQMSELNFLKDNGFAVSPETKVASSVGDVWKLFNELRSSRSHLPYGIDGMVVKIDDNRIHQQAGMVGKTPRAWCALKFGAEEAPTRLLNVIWQVGRTGKVTPVAEMEPVLLDGSTVQRATLHNAQEIDQRKLHIGDMVVIRKAGDIIPEVVEVLDNLRQPSTDPIVSIQYCPTCYTELIRSNTGVDLYCPNTQKCKDQIIGRLSYFASRKMGNISGLSAKQIERFIDLYGVQDIPDLFDLDYNSISQLDGFGEKSAQNLEESTVRAATISDVQFLASIGIDGVGVEAAKLIITMLNTSTDAD